MQHKFIKKCRTKKGTKSEEASGFPNSEFLRKDTMCVALDHGEGDPSQEPGSLPHIVVCDGHLGAEFAEKVAG